MAAATFPLGRGRSQVRHDDAVYQGNGPVTPQTPGLYPHRGSGKRMTRLIAHRRCLPNRKGIIKSATSPVYLVERSEPDG